MDLSRHLILLNGQPKTMQIDIIKKKCRMAILCALRITPKAIIIVVIMWYGLVIQGG